jgi:RNAse (barnase) inhibitor barstar
MKENEINTYKKEGYYVGIIDGKKCFDIKSFLNEIGIAFKFPDYYGQNLSAFDECINDLDWIIENKYLLIIDNANSFIESKIEDKNYILNKLNEVSKEWKNVPNYEGEEAYRKAADFKILYK